MHHKFKNKQIMGQEQFEFSLLNCECIVCLRKWSCNQPYTITDDELQLIVDLIETEVNKDYLENKYVMNLTARFTYLGEHVDFLIPIRKRNKKDLYRIDIRHLLPTIHKMLKLSAKIEK